MLRGGEQPTAELRLGLIGAGIGASLTPRMHEREAARLGITCRYALLDLDELDPVPPLAQLLADAEGAGWRGVNVTHPCKRDVLEHVDALSPEATTLGAVNTVVFEDGRRSGHNTDWSGFAEGLRRGLPDARLHDVVVLGAGGAGGAVVFALLRLGAGRIQVLDADADRAHALAARFAGVAGVAGGTVDAAGAGELAARLPAADGLVHATPTGMAAHPGSAVAAELLREDLWVADVVYRPLQTELLRTARARGCATLDGSGMAVFQAVHAFELFTGTPADDGAMARTFAEAIREEQRAWTRD